VRRLPLVGLGLLVLAAIEITIFIVVGKAIGAGWTVLLVLATSVLGAWALRRIGPRSWRTFRDDVQEGRPPGNSVTEGVLALVGGVMLLVPGFLTDFVGALLLIPLVRRLVGGGVSRRLTGRLRPDVANSLFGPRRVRARAGANPDSGPPPPPGSVESPPIEGEIIDPH
jgi:UPF0716 protein FxsA